MMIEKHISALLYRYQCVTVPGFGAFLTEIRTAQLDTAANTFYPPKKLISFNANLKNNDGLLANHIALQEKISYTQAVANIEQVVDTWLSRLSQRETLGLKNLGEMSCNLEGSLVFAPDTPINYFTDAFGLTAVVSPAVKREVYKQQAEAIEELAPVIFTPERKKDYSYLKYAAVFVLMASVGGAGFKMYRDNEVATQTLLVENAVQEKVQQKIQQATFFIENPMPAVKLPVKEEYKVLPYHVVAGAFKSEANAQKAVQQLIEKGFKARMIEKNKFGLYPVVYGSFATYAEAHENMNEIHRTVNKEAWLLVKEL
ncbi:SPOR domain-containing protein [Flavobacterium sp. DGU11]|uniref:SPOR domain-containing protein n=1 Tax=Flavobacterium arundinis TaxID=3139143 RepID=A0ABU9I0N2_9FLAO